MNIDDLDLQDKHEGEYLTEFCKKLQQHQEQIEELIRRMENIDLKLAIISYTIYAKQHEFKTELSTIQQKRGDLEVADLTVSLTNLQVMDLDQQVSDLRDRHDQYAFTLNQEKLAEQRRLEEAFNQLDLHLDQLKGDFEDFSRQVEQKKLKSTPSEKQLISEKYDPPSAEFSSYITACEKRQLAGWRIANSETEIDGILDDYGLKITKSGYLLTQSGEKLTYGEAQRRGFFGNAEFPVEKIKSFVATDDEQAEESVRSAASSESSKGESTLSSADVNYLKTSVGRPLTLALAEITAKHPKDPIHYLGHYLFKYRYNQEIEEIKKREMEELENERQTLAKERWKRFVAEEARSVVLDLILRTEAILYEKELKRIEEETAAAAAAEEEEADEEARDQFDETLM